MNRQSWFIVFFLIFISVFPIFYKVFKLEMPFLPAVTKNLWDIELNINIKESDKKGKIAFPIIKPSDRIKIKSRSFDLKGMKLAVKKMYNYDIAYLSGERESKKNIVYSTTVELKDKSYKIPNFDNTTVSKKRFWRYLQYPKLTGEESNLVKELESEIIPNTNNRIRIIKSIYYYIYEEMTTPGKIKQNLLEALELGEANNYNKTEIFKILSIRQGIPARTITGIYLKEYRKKRKKKSIPLFYWNEVFINNQWVPICPTLGNFARITEYYLPLYTGSTIKDLMKDKDANLKIYIKRTQSTEFTVKEYRKELAKTKSYLFRLSLYNLPLHVQLIFQTLLLIPLGAIALAFFRNMVGIKTFGIFMPVLMALFFQETSFLFGFSFFVFLIFLGFMERYLLEKLHLLAVPRLSIILCLVVIFLAFFSIFNSETKWFSKFTPALFPIVITTVFIERFSIMLIEEGMQNTLKALAGTIFVSWVAYLLFTIKFFRVVIFTYPEILFLYIAVFILIGKYTGYRLTEFIRFREMLKGKG